MDKIQYDVRPIDTENVINARNRIRLSSTLNLFGVLLYLSVRSSMVQPQASWAHLLHFLIDPIAIFVTIIDNTNYVFFLFISTVFALFVDSSVLILNFIAASRCIGDRTATCFERLYESAIWLFIAGWFVLIGIFQVTQIYAFVAQLKEKDRIEAANREMLQSERRIPTWNSIVIFSRKIKTINLFLLTFDVVYAITMATQIADMPILAIGFLHMLIDPFVYFTINDMTEQTMYEIFRITYSVSATCNVIVIVLLMQTNIATIANMLSLMISTLFLVMDVVQVIYTSIVVDTMNEFKRFKDKFSD